MALDHAQRPPLDEDAVLRKLVEGTAGSTGENFFEALVENLASALDTHGAWVAEYLPESRQLRALAMKMGDGWHNGLVYDIEGTPCQTVIDNDTQVHVPERIIEIYPTDPDLEPHAAVSYMGAPLKTAGGEIMGHLAVLDDKPMSAEPSCLAVFRIFAARAAAELRRLRAEQATRERETQLARLVDSAMDAILNLDADLGIVLMNDAARKVFRCAREDLRGEPVARLFSGESHERLQACAARLGDGAGADYQWIGGGLQAVTRDGETFPAEATLSQYDTNGRRRYTLILRNVNDRLQAEERIRSLTNETEYLREELTGLRDAGNIVGESRALLRTLHDVEQVAETRTTVLLLGETGTGKELFARAIHHSSPRRDKSMVRLNCAAIPKELMESELFGHSKGAFTGATENREGRFALADGGTLFLDEVGELPLDLQAKLLRVLQEGEFEPLGSAATKRVDVRIVAATNRDLRRAVESGSFREDLFYRLNVFPVRIPPLRDRDKDVILLADRFIERFSRQAGRHIEPLSEPERLVLRSYHWPGNVRELQNVIERAVITAKNGRLDLARALSGTPDENPPSSPHVPAPRGVLTDAQLRDLERDNIRRALEQAGWKVSGADGAAARLGLKPSTLSSRMRALGIERPAS